MKTKRVGCSRYVQGHLKKYRDENPETAGPIALSFADFSYWCYECDSYVVSKLLNQVKYFYP